MSKADITLDASGLICPMPVLKVKKMLQSMQPEQILEAVVTDEAAVKDIPILCEMAGYVLLESKQEAGKYIFLIRKSYR